MSENESTKRSEMESLIHQAANRALVFSQNLILDETTNLVEKVNKVHYYQNSELSNVIESAMKSLKFGNTKVVEKQLNKGKTQS